jgi:hypothetical protein
MKRPVESEYTSHVAYARALEEYCDSLPQLAQEPYAPVTSLQAHAMAQVCLDLHDALGCKWGDNPYLTISQLKAAAPDLQAELEATNKQVEILSDALAESRREVAALKAVQEPVAWMYQCTTDNSGPVLLRHRTNWAKSGTGLWIETPLYTTPPAQPAPVQQQKLERE